MATNFKVWIDNPDATSQNPNVEKNEDYAQDEKRIEGWKAGDPISSLKMNSILRQNSLIAVALAEAFFPKTTLGILSSVDDIKTEMLASIALKSNVDSLALSVSTLSSNVASIQGQISTIQRTITGLSNGTSAAGNALKLGGNLPAYYQKAITSGTSNPTGGSNGDIYIKYT